MCTCISVTVLLIISDLLQTISNTYTVKAKMSKSNLHFKIKRDIVRTISSIVCKSYGPDCQQTLLCTSTGMVLVTSDGMCILHSLHLCHPVATVVVKAIQKHHLMTRDGTKTFSLYLSQAVTDLDKTLNCSLSTDHIGTSVDQFCYTTAQHLIRIERDVLPQIWRELSQNSTVKHVEGNLPLIKLRSVINTCLASHLTKHTRHVLLELVLSSLGASESGIFTDISIGVLKRQVTFMIDNFDFLHFKLPKQLCETSSFLPGFLLRQDFLVKHPRLGENEDIKFLMLSCSVEGSSNENPDEVVFLKDKEAAYTALSYRVTRASKYLTDLKQKDVSLILCSETVPQFARSLCRDLGISVISCVEQEDIHFIERITGVQAATSISGSVDSMQTGQLSSCDRIVLGTQRVAHLQFAKTKTFISPRTIVIAAPTDGLVDQFRTAVYKSYKSVQMCFAFQVTCNTDDSLGENCYQEKPEDLTTSSDSGEFCVIGGGGFFELRTAGMLKKLSNNFTDVKIGHGCQVLHDCLLSVPRHLHKQLSPDHGTKGRDYLEKLQQLWATIEEGGVAGLDRKGRICKPVDVGILEPLASKVLTLTSVVQLLQQLLRIDAVVSVQKLEAVEMFSDDDL
ncbi:Bardet-Biedl syndrome 10 protein homolog [Haliotis rubra]|uniref:Bardet-Biedl syndrome 10 protein homolog n=1 Tax=Haliotis rubra TaxID=36100 RepID=UPI001EE51274|nr:Bardet-Biedl syndrome 10 protein homolog [Haliotis rubra]